MSTPIIRFVAVLALVAQVVLYALVVFSEQPLRISVLSVLVINALATLVVHFTFGALKIPDSMSQVFQSSIKRGLLMIASMGVIFSLVGWAFSALAGLMFIERSFVTTWVFGPCMWLLMIFTGAVRALAIRHSQQKAAIVAQPLPPLPTQL